MSANPVSPPPKFFGNLGQAPVTERDWDQFYRWLFSLWRQVQNGENPGPPIPPLPPTVSAESAITEVLARSGVTIPPPPPEATQGPLSALIPVRVPPQSVDTSLLYHALNRVVPPFPVPGANAPLLDTYANWTSTNYPPAVYAVGTPFVISDWNVLYSVRLVAGTPTWVYETGIYIAAFASRPTTGFSGAALGTNDAGLTFLASDTLLFYYWSGAAWVPVTPSMGGVYPTQDLTGTFPTPTLNNTGVTAATYGDATHVPQLTVDAHGRLSLVSNVAITAGSASTGTWTPGIQFNGTSTGTTYGTQSGTYWTSGNLVVAYFDMTLTAKGSSTGFAEVTGLPVPVSLTYISGGTMTFYQNMLGVKPTPAVLPTIGTNRAVLLMFTATDGVTMDDTNFTNTSRIVGLCIYYS